MSTATDLARVTRKFDKLAAGLGVATKDGVNAGARLVGAAVQTQILADVGADSRMSGLGGKKFAGVGGGLVQVSVKPSTSNVNSTAYVGPSGAGMAGAFGILEGGTAAHAVGGKTSSKIARVSKAKKTAGQYVRLSPRKQTGRKLMATPWGPRWGPFMVGGAPAKRTVSKALRRVERYVPKAIQAETRQAIVKAFR